MDDDPSGFEWINADDGDRSIFSFIRKAPTGRNNILVVCNFTPMERPDYRVGVPKKKQYKLLMTENGLAEPKFSKLRRRNAITAPTALPTRFRLMGSPCFCIDGIKDGGDMP